MKMLRSGVSLILPKRSDFRQSSLIAISIPGF
jgi:hypothetical protein